MMMKIGLIGIVAIFLTMPLKKEKGEFALLVILVSSLIIFIYAMAKMQTVVDFLRQLVERLPIDSTYLMPLLKMLGVMYVADFASSVCREAGYSSVASQMELFAKLSIIALSIPELTYLVDVLEKFL